MKYGAGKATLLAWFAGTLFGMSFPLAPIPMWTALPAGLLAMVAAVIAGFKDRKN